MVSANLQYDIKNWNYSLKRKKIREEWLKESSKDQVSWFCWSGVWGSVHRRVHKCRHTKLAVTADRS